MGSKMTAMYYPKTDIQQSSNSGKWKLFLDDTHPHVELQAQVLALEWETHSDTVSAAVSIFEFGKVPTYRYYLEFQFIGGSSYRYNTDDPVRDLGYISGYTYDSEVGYRLFGKDRLINMRAVTTISIGKTLIIEDRLLKQEHDNNANNG